MAKTTTTTQRARRHARIRARISGTAERPRLCVYKSNKALEAQLIDDTVGKTIVSARGVDAQKIGAEIAAAALAHSIKAVVFDRGGYIYTGKVRALAEAARGAGLTF